MWLEQLKGISKLAVHERITLNRLMRIRFNWLRINKMGILLRTHGRNISVSICYHLSASVLCVHFLPSLCICPLCSFVTIALHLSFVFICYHLSASVLCVHLLPSLCTCPLCSFVTISLQLFFVFICYHLSPYILYAHFLPSLSIYSLCSFVTISLHLPSVFICYHLSASVLCVHLLPSLSSCPLCSFVTFSPHLSFLLCFHLPTSLQYFILVTIKFSFRAGRSDFIRTQSGRLLTWNIDYRD
jgi:hypothetical protein